MSRDNIRNITYLLYIDTLYLLEQQKPLIINVVQNSFVFLHSIDIYKLPVLITSMQVYFNVQKSPIK